MKTSNLLMLISILTCASVITSCSKDDAEVVNNGAVRFTSSIGQQAISEGGSNTRAAGENWTNGDAIGIFMVNTGGTAIAANKQYTTAGNISFTAVAGNEIYYPVDGSTVDFTAYYPYQATAAFGTSLDIEIGDQTKQPEFDLLWAQTTTGYNKTSINDVALEFEHKLAKIVMNIVQPSSLNPNTTGLTEADLAGMDVVIKGMNTKNTFNLSTGSLGDTPNTAQPIAPRTLTDAVAYDAIILPGAYADGVVTVEFTLSTGETFTWNVGAKTFVTGNEYIYEVKVTRTGITATGTIKPWNPGTGGTGVAD